MKPEAFKEGGSKIGLAAMAGFTIAFGVVTPSVALLLCR